MLYLTIINKFNMLFFNQLFFYVNYILKNFFFYNKSLFVKIFNNFILKKIVLKNNNLSCLLFKLFIIVKYIQNIYDYKIVKNLSKVFNKVYNFSDNIFLYYGRSLIFKTLNSKNFFRILLVKISENIFQLSLLLNITTSFILFYFKNLLVTNKFNYYNVFINNFLLYVSYKYAKKKSLYRMRYIYNSKISIKKSRQSLTLF